MLDGLFYHNSLVQSTSTRCLASFYYYYVLLKIPVINANSVDPDQMPPSAAFDLSLYHLPITFCKLSLTKMG